METYDVMVWDEEEEEFWTYCTTHKSGKDLDELIERLKKEYNTDVWAVIA